MKLKSSDFRVIILLLLCLISVTSEAQKRVLGRPIAFENPTLNVQANDLRKVTKEKESDIPWIVICDRTEETQIYSKPNYQSEEVAKVKFRDWFYVTGEDGDWIRIATAKLKSGTKINGKANNLGWIEKKNLLLWTTGLVDPITKIHSKAFLLNRASEIEKIIKQQRKEIVKIFSGPSTGETIGEKTIYEFYYVLKKEKDRYLLSKEVRLSPNYNLESNLVGWVRFDRVAEWNTRICLEPNFVEEAFNERKQNDNYQLIGFSEETSASNYSKNEKLGVEKIIWKNDPVKIDQEKLATLDPRRFLGQVVRFPLLKNTKEYFRSGVIGDIYINEALESIDELNYSGIVSRIKESENSRSNFNIFFLIEGTPSMRSYKYSIIETIDKLKASLYDIPNVKFGAGVYRDGLEEEKRVFEIQELTSDDSKVKTFLQNSQFSRWQDNDNYTAMYNGLDRALVEAGFNLNHTNIIYILGNYGDYSSYILRKRQADKVNDPTLVDIRSVIEKLSKLNIHLVSIQGKRNDGKRSETFIDQNKYLLLEAAKDQYNTYKGVVDYVPDITLLGEENIQLIESVEDNMVRLNGGSVKGYSYYPTEGGTLSTSVLNGSIEKSSSEIRQFVIDFWKEMNKVIEDGASFDAFSAGALAPAAASEIVKLLKSNKQSWEEEDLKKLAKNKYQLYKEVFFPKMINGATYPPHSFVLFMPEDDLEQYLNQIESISYSFHAKGTNELRQEIFNMFIDLLKYYTGNENVKELRKKSTEDVRRLMQGISDEGLDLSQAQDFVILDVMNTKRMNDEKLRKFAERIIENAGKLKRIINKGKSYEFSYNPGGGNTYFWIPIEWTF